MFFQAACHRPLNLGDEAERGRSIVIFNIPVIKCVSNRKLKDLVIGKGKEWEVWSYPMWLEIKHQESSPVTLLIRILKQIVTANCIQLAYNVVDAPLWFNVWIMAMYPAIVDCWLGIRMHYICIWNCHRDGGVSLGDLGMVAWILTEAIITPPPPPPPWWGVGLTLVNFMLSFGV